MRIKNKNYMKIVDFFKSLGSFKLKRLYLALLLQKHSRSVKLKGKMNEFFQKSVAVFNS